MASVSDEVGQMSDSEQEITSIERPISSFVIIFKFTFLTRCLNLLDGFIGYERWYIPHYLRIWLGDLQAAIQLEGVTEIFYRLLHPGFIRLLCTDQPFSAEDILSLDTWDPGNYYAVYACIVKVIDSSTETSYYEIYFESATGKKGFEDRRKVYTRLRYSGLPTFLKKHVDERDVFEVVAIVPIARAYGTDSVRFSVSDIRLIIKILESFLMVLGRSLKKGGEYEKLLAYGPFKAEDLEYVRCDLGLSLFEYIKGVPKVTREALEEEEEQLRVARAEWVRKSKVKRQMTGTFEELQADRVRRDNDQRLRHLRRKAGKAIEYKTWNKANEADEAAGLDAAVWNVVWAPQRVTKAIPLEDGA